MVIMDEIPRRNPRQTSDGETQLLSATISKHYSFALSDAEAKEAASNLLGFMELLLEIDAEHGITRASQCEVQP